MKNKVLAMFLILTMLSLGIKTYATTISDYQSQQKQTQDEKDKAKENLQSVTAEKNKDVREEIFHIVWFLSVYCSFVLQI